MNRLIRLFALLVLVLTLPLTVAAKPKYAYEITLKIKDGKDTIMIMGHYYGRGNTPIDTATIDSRGRFVFTGTNPLHDGLYFFANPNGTYVEFVVYHEKPFFTFETEEGDWTAHMHVKGSKENEFFYQFHHAKYELDQDLRVNQRKMDSAAFATYYRQRIREFENYQADLVEKHPEKMLSKMLLSVREVETPWVDEKGDSLTQEQMRDYFFSHYFDDIPLDEDFIVRTPKNVFYDPVMKFYDTYLKYAPPDVIIPYLDSMLDRSMKAPEVFKYLVMQLTQKYLQSNVMVYDEIYVHLVKKYFASDANTWSSPSNIEKELTRAEKWERLLVGHVAPELILFDTLRVPHSLHAMPNRWKILIFWSPNCGHCKHVIPEVYKIYMQYRDQYDIGVFAILSEPDDKTRVDWRDFLKNHAINSPSWINLDGGEANVDWHDVYDIVTTPQIYLIDENNIIVAKKLGEETIERAINVICAPEQSNSKE